MTGKIKEEIDIGRAETISDVISKLDKKYPGFEEVFMPPGKVFNYNTAIYLRRPGQATFSIIDEKQRIEQGDVILFW